MTRFVRDLRGAFRSLRSRPRFSALVVSAFALGIAANVSVFSLVDRALFGGLPYERPADLVIVWETHETRGFARIPAAPGKFQDWQRERALFASMAMFRTDAMDGLLGEEARRLRVGQVSPEYFSTLGMEPVMGRGFHAREAVPGANHVVLLGHGFWERWYGADPDVVGRSVTLDGQPHTIVGVLPEPLAFPADVDLFRPLALEYMESRSAHAYRVLARLATGVTVSGARAGMDQVAARLAADRPDTDAGFGVEVQTLRERVMGERTAGALLLFQGAVGLLLLITCANVASLMMVRASGRARETAVRTALGAGRRALVSLWVAEGLVLSMAGGLLGMALAGPLTGALLAWSPGTLPAALTGVGVADGPWSALLPAIDLSSLLFVIGLATVGGVVFGVLPALGGLRHDPARALRSGSHGSTGGPGRSRAAWVVSELALATVLAVGSGLFLRSFLELASVDPGFRAEGVVAGEIRPTAERYPTGAERLVLYHRVLENVEAIPGVVSAGAVNYLPMGGRSDGYRFQIEGQPVDRFADLYVVHMRAANPGYFDALGIELVRGRGIAVGDRAGSEPVAVVNGVMADRFWPDSEVLDARISLNGDDGPWVRIVGVVENVRHAGLEAEPEPELYVPLEQDAWPAMSIVAAGNGRTGPALDAFREAVRDVDPFLTVGGLTTLESLVAESAAPWRFQASVVTAFGAMAVFLACLGVFGLLNLHVSERTRELGVRRALGATAREIGRLVRGRLLRLGALGVGLGVAAALVLTRLATSMLYGVTTLDPWSYVAAAALMLGAALVAGWLPARRAARVEPVEALRAD